MEEIPFRIHKITRRNKSVPVQFCYFGVALFQRNLFNYNFFFFHIILFKALHQTMFITIKICYHFQEQWTRENSLIFVTFVRIF